MDIIAKHTEIMSKLREDTISKHDLVMKLTKDIVTNRERLLELLKVDQCKAVRESIIVSINLIKGVRRRKYSRIGFWNISEKRRLQKAYVNYMVEASNLYVDC